MKLIRSLWALALRTFTPSHVEMTEPVLNSRISARDVGVAAVVVVLVVVQAVAPVLLRLRARSALDGVKPPKLQLVHQVQHPW
jgi:hypothetical protein